MKTEKEIIYKPYKDGHKTHTKVYAIRKVVDKEGKVFKSKMRLVRIMKNFVPSKAKKVKREIKKAEKE